MTTKHAPYMSRDLMIVGKATNRKNLTGSIHTFACAVGMSLCWTKTVRQGNILMSQATPNGNATMRHVPPYNHQYVNEKEPPSGHHSGRRFFLCTVEDDYHLLRLQYNIVVSENQGGYLSVTRSPIGISGFSGSG